MPRCCIFRTGWQKRTGICQVCRRCGCIGAVNVDSKSCDVIDPRYQSENMWQYWDKDLPQGEHGVICPVGGELVAFSDKKAYCKVKNVMGQDTVEVVPVSVILLRIFTKAVKVSSASGGS